MNQQERIGIGELWISIANMHGREMPKMTLKILLDAVNDLPADRIHSALIAWINDPNARSYPTPGQVRQMINPKIENRDLARETSLRIRQAVSKFGWPNPTQAQEFIGEAGWRVVERFGGWSHICENLGTEIPEHAFLAQCRDALESGLNLEKAGIDLERPAIEQARTTGRIGSVIQSLTQKLSITGREEKPPR